MATTLYTILLSHFAFPKKLPNDKANFRFVATVRYVGRLDKLLSVPVVMPGLDSYWECDARKRNDPGYVRRPGAAEFDIGAIDTWDRMVLHMKAEAVHSIQFRVFDVDRKDAWDRIESVLADFATRVVGAAPKLVPAIPLAAASDTAGSAVGALADDLEVWLVQKLAAQKDRLLFRGSHFFDDPSSPAAGLIEGRGVAGGYEIGFDVVT